MSNEMTNSMQESDTGIDCFQNYTASEIFVQGLAGLVNFGDCSIMIRHQKQMLQRFEKSNEMLVNCNALSTSRLKNSQEDFKKMTKQLLEMKKDLDYVFRKVRTIKSKLATQYPKAYENAESKMVHVHDIEEDEEIVEEVDDDEVLQVEFSNPDADGREVPKLSMDKRQPSKDKTTVHYMKMEERNDLSE